MDRQTENKVINFLKGFVITEYAKRMFKELIENIGSSITDFYTKTESDAKFATKTELGVTDNTANEALAIARGAQIADVFATYEDLVEYLNSAEKDEFIVGKNFYIKEIKVGNVNIPDCWISAVNTTSVEYDFVSETDFVDDLTQTEGVQVGYYTLNQLEGAKINYTDIENISVCKPPILDTSAFNDKLPLGPDDTLTDDIQGWDVTDFLPYSDYGQIIGNITLLEKNDVYDEGTIHQYKLGVLSKTSTELNIRVVGKDGIIPSSYAGSIEIVYTIATGELSITTSAALTYVNAIELYKRPVEWDSKKYIDDTQSQYVKSSVLTQAQYEELETKENDVLYFIV